MKQLQEMVPKSDSGEKTYAISLFKDWDGNMMMCAKNYASFYGYNELGFVLTKADGSDIQNILDDDGQYVRALRFYLRLTRKDLWIRIPCSRIMRPFPINTVTGRF